MSASLADLGGAWGTHAPPWASKFFRFHAVFGKIWRVHAPLEGSRPPLGKILDPPLGLTPDSLPNTLPVLLGHCSFTSVINYRCYRIPRRSTCVLTLYESCAGTESDWCHNKIHMSLQKKMPYTQEESGICFFVNQIPERVRQCTLKTMTLVLVFSVWCVRMSILYN